MPTSNVAPLFQKGLQFNLLAGLEQYKQAAKYDKVFKVRSTDYAFEDFQRWTLYDIPQLTQQREPVAFSETQPDFSLRLIPQKYTLADSWSWEAMEDDQYGLLNRLIPSSGGSMAISFSTLYERLAAQYIFSTGFTSTSPAPGSPDGQPLFSLSHPIAINNANTWANRPTNASDLSNTTYNVAIANMQNTPASNNYTIMPMMGFSILFNPSIRAVAYQIAGGDWERGTSNFQMNTGVKDGVSLIEWPYIQYGQQSSTQNYNAWAVQADSHQLIWLNRKSYTVRAWDDEQTQTHVAAAYCRMDFGHIDWRGMYGSQGAAA